MSYTVVNDKFFCKSLFTLTYSGRIFAVHWRKTVSNQALSASSEDLPTKLSTPLFAFIRLHSPSFANPGLQFTIAQSSAAGLHLNCAWTAPELHLNCADPWAPEEQQFIPFALYLRMSFFLNRINDLAAPRCACTQSYPQKLCRTARCRATLSAGAVSLVLGAPILPGRPG